MGGYFPSAALQIQPQPSIGDQLARAVQLRSLIGSQQLQQGQIQEQQMQIENMRADQAAYHAANQQWQPNSQGQLDPNDFLDLMRKNGATPQTVMKLQQMQLQREETASITRKNNLEAAKQAADLQSQKMEKIAGDIDNLKGVPADQYQSKLGEMLQQRVQDGTFSAQEAAGYAQVPQSQLEGIQKHILGEKAFNDNQKTLADADKARQDAALAKMKAGAIDVDTSNQRATARYQQYHPGQALPTYLTLPQGANLLQEELRDKNLEALEKAEATKQNTAATREATAAQRGVTNAIAQQGLELRQQKAQEPTADEQRRADLARNMNENLDQVSDLVTRRPDLFGPVAGRLTQLRSKVGTADPDIAKLEAVKEYLGMASVGAHAMRNAQHVETAANAILNNFTNSPEAVKAAIASARQSTNTFLQDEMRRKNKALAREGGTQPATPTAAPPAAVKILSRAALQQAAKDHGVSEQEAERQARAAGYNIQ